MCSEKEIKKILIADDEKDMVDFLEQALKREGFDVVTAFDGQEAKSRIVAENPNAILLDLQMPQIDGWEVLRWLRQEQKSTIPVIIISAKDEMGDIKKGYAFQADHYITKPVKIKDVVNSLETISFLKKYNKD